MEYQDYLPPKLKNGKFQQQVYSNNGKQKEIQVEYSHKINDSQHSINDYQSTESTQSNQVKYTYTSKQLRKDFRVITNKLIAKLYTQYEPLKVNMQIKLFYLLKLILSVYIVSFLMIQLIVREQTQFYTIEYNNKQVNTFSLQTVEEDKHCQVMDQQGYIQNIEKENEILFALFLYVSFKVIYLIKQSRDTYIVFKKGFVTDSMKYTVKFFDIVNIFYDVIFAIPLSPLTAFFYNQTCIYMSYGLDFIDASAIFIIALIFSAINVILFIFQLIVSNRIVSITFQATYNFLYFLFPTLIYSWFKQIKHKKSSAVYYFECMTKEKIYDGNKFIEDKLNSSRDSQKIESNKCADYTVFMVNVGFIVLTIIILIPSIPFMFYFSLKIMNGYYVLTFILTALSFHINKSGSVFYTQYLDLMTISTFFDSEDFKEIFGEEAQKQIFKIHSNPHLVKSRSDCLQFLNNPESIFKIRTLQLLFKIYWCNSILDDAMFSYQQSLL